MIPVSGVSTAVPRPLTAAEAASGSPEIRKSAEADESRPVKPAADEYVPEEKREPSGRYWLGRDENGRPKVYFDSPEHPPESPGRPAGAPGGEQPEENKPTVAPERKSGNEERCAGNTDKVDREIEKLKKEKRELEQRLNTETDGRKLGKLKKRLAQVERELCAKDNDTYRRQHSTFTRLS